MAAKGSTYRWKSGTFLATYGEIERGSGIITNSLEAQGISVAGGASGGGYVVPWPANYAANVRLLKDMDADDARSMVERAMSDAFNFTNAVTSVWEAVQENIAADFNDVKDLPKEGFPYILAISVGLSALAVIYVTSKVT